MLVGTKKDFQTDGYTKYELAKKQLEPVKVEDGHVVASKCFCLVIYTSSIAILTHSQPRL